MDFRPDTVVRDAQQLGDLVQLVDFVLSGAERGLFDDFADYHPCCPHVHGRGVTVCAEQEFWRTVPDRDDTRGQGAFRVLAGETKVGDLEDALSGEQEIAGFDVSVDDISVVQVLQTLEQLLRQAFNFALRIVDSRVVKKIGQVLRVLQPRSGSAEYPREKTSDHPSESPPSFFRRRKERRL